MNFKFTSTLDYQLDAINSVIDLFEGSQIKNGIFSISIPQLMLNNYSGISNRLQINRELLLENLQNIQLRNNLKRSLSLSDNEDLIFDIEMETGTGKTYVFLRTILELNKKYNLKKFIIVVPSVAIKEGILKTLQMIKSHFCQIYNNIPYDYFIYDSNNLTAVSWFARNNNIEIMIITIQAFNKDLSNINTTNVMYYENDTIGNKPIELIKQTNPIIIIDEPQTSAETIKSKIAIKNLNPLFTLRYSATFKSRSNLIYKLDSIDAFNKGIVKKIQIIDYEIDSPNSSKIYIKLISTNAKNLSALVELKFLNKKGEIEKKEIKVFKNEDFYEITKNSIYLNQNFIVTEISFIDNSIKFLNGIMISSNYQLTELSNDKAKKLQIRYTIEQHLKMQLDLKRDNVKVLSLFFIDRVSNYRKTVNKEQIFGKYALWFEELFIKIASSPKYKSLFINQNIETLAKTVHGGYFSGDKKGVKDTKGTSKLDQQVYQKIMRDKENLINFNEPLAFIFSHSALKEGWDNPNVFQICTLNENSESKIKKKQEIGRGLRICVNQSGERLIDNPNNILTIIVNNAYKEFVDQLQKEIESDEGIKFRKFTNLMFAQIEYEVEINGINTITVIGSKKSNSIYDELIKLELIDVYGNADKKIIDLIKIKDFLINENHNLKNAVLEVINDQKRILKITRSNSDKELKFNKEFLNDKNFINFWKIISKKTTYRINFDDQKLIDETIKNINTFLDENPISNSNIEIKKMTSKLSFNHSTCISENINYDDDLLIHEITNYDIPDILSNIEEQTNLKRKTIYLILLDSKIFDHIIQNPLECQNIVIKIINKSKLNILKDGLEYIIDEDQIQQKNIDENDFLQSSIINSKEIISVNKNSNNYKKYPYNYVLCDSKIEFDFAKEAFNSPLIYEFIKFPKKFKIKTPVGSYNPDFGLLTNNFKNFVIETKGSNDDNQLRKSEKDKIDFAKKHFSAISKEYQKVIFEKNVIFDEIKKLIIERNQF